MAAATTSSSQTSPSPDPKYDLSREIKRLEVAIAELDSLPSSRGMRSEYEILEAGMISHKPVYLKNGNIFFRTTTQKAISSEQRKLNLAKSKLQKLNKQ